MASLPIVFCRKSTLLCRQEVRRSMVFSTVQISMPGTSCAVAVCSAYVFAAASSDTVRSDLAITSRAVIKILDGALPAFNSLRANFGGADDNTGKPHSGVEVLRGGTI